MCLSVVGEIVGLIGNKARVQISGIELTVSIELIDCPRIGDKLLIHAGCAIARLSQMEFDETVEALALLKAAQYE